MKRKKKEKNPFSNSSHKTFIKLPDQSFAIFVFIAKKKFSSFAKRLSVPVFFEFIFFLEPY